MIKASIDRPKLEKSLRKYAKAFGETSAQAVVRWSVQTCRELAMETQVWGRSKTKGKQEGAIFKDSLNVLLVGKINKEFRDRYTTGANFKNQSGTVFIKNERILDDAKSVNDWIDLNRTRRNGRTAKLPWIEKKACDIDVHKKAMRERYKRAGMAKGGWIGAGRDIARGQTGMDKVDIGASFLKYAQKHAHFGSAVKPVDGWKPSASITNSVAHTASSHVLSRQASTKAINFGLKKSVKFYASALRAIDKKQKP